MERTTLAAKHEERVRRIVRSIVKARRRKVELFRQRSKRRVFAGRCAVCIVQQLRIRNALAVHTDPKRFQPLNVASNGVADNAIRLFELNACFA